MTYHLKDLGDGRYDLVRVEEVSLGVLTNRAIAERFIEFLDAAPGYTEIGLIDIEDAPAAAENPESHNKNGMPWSAEEDAEMLRLHDLGTRHAAIAASLNRTLAATRTRLNNMLRERRGEFDKKQAVAMTESQALVLRHVAALDDDEFTPDDDLLLFGAMTSGVPIEVISDQLGCDTKAVSDRWFALLPDFIVTAKGALTVQGADDMRAVLTARVAGV